MCSEIVIGEQPDSKLSGKPEMRKWRRFAAAAVLALALAGCETMSGAWEGTKNTVGGLFGGGDEDADTATSSENGDSSSSGDGSLVAGGSLPGMSSGSGGFRSTRDTATPSLSSVPSQAPTPPSTEAERKRVTEGLIADREKAQYTDQGGRRDPVTVRPLSNAIQTASDLTTPPVPAAAPTEPVTRLAEVPNTSTGADQVAPRTTSLAERLGAAPPPPPDGEPRSPFLVYDAQPASTMDANAPAALAATAPQPTPMPAAPAMNQALVPQYVPPSQMYGDETIVIDSSGIAGGTRQLALAPVAPRAAFDPGNASVMSQVGLISFTPGSTALSSRAKTVLADAARLRADVDGAIRVVARGDRADQRANAVVRELKRLGVPASRLYQGAADGFGDEAEIFLDY
ncbi:MAG: hypothetical protein KDE14_15190 [Rhodobacteraceae bacterium]|nr:hypothetical protein [Paracoccaceae bacterium]